MPNDDAVPGWLLGDRPHPTVEAMLGAVGGLVVLGGVSALYGEAPEGDTQMAGVALATLTLVVGCLLPVLGRVRAFDVAGVVLAAGAVLPLAFFLVIQPDTQASRSDFFIAMVLAVLAWLALYSFGPARGHGLLLGAALFGLWLGALSQTSPEEFFVRFRPVQTERVETELGPFPVEPPEGRFPTVPPPTFQLRPPSTFRLEPPPTFREVPPPPPLRDPRTTTSTTAGVSLGGARLVGQFGEDFETDEPPVAPAVVSMFFGIAYLAAAAWVDSARLRRAASPFAAVGIAALAVGTVLAGPRLGATAAASLGLVFSIGVLAFGVAARRRLVAWLGAGAAAVSLSTGIGSIFDDSAARAGVAMLVVGVCVVVLGAAAADREQAGA